MVIKILVFTLKSQILTLFGSDLVLQCCNVSVFVKQVLYLLHFNLSERYHILRDWSWHQLTHPGPFGISLIIIIFVRYLTSSPSSWTQH